MPGTGDFAAASAPGGTTPLWGSGSGASGFGGFGGSGGMDVMGLFQKMLGGGAAAAPVAPIQPSMIMGGPGSGTLPIGINPLYPDDLSKLKLGGLDNGFQFLG